jgi:hypothetical protein
MIVPERSRRPALSHRKSVPPFPIQSCRRMQRKKQAGNRQITGKKQDAIPVPVLFFR